MLGRDFMRLTNAVHRVLQFMGEERLHQLRVEHKDLARLAGLTNTRLKSLQDKVDDVLVLPGTMEQFGTFLVTDHGISPDGSQHLVLVKKNTLLHRLVIGENEEFSHRP